MIDTRNLLLQSLNYISLKWIYHFRRNAYRLENVTNCFFVIGILSKNNYRAPPLTFVSMVIETYFFSDGIDTRRVLEWVCSIIST